MSTRDNLLDSWRAKLADGTHDDCMSSLALKPGSFCTVFSMCWGGPGTCMFSALAPEYFDTPGDFVAFVRVVELPRSLYMMINDRDESRERAEDYLDVVDPESRPLLVAAIEAADAALAKPEVSATDADAVISAFNALFGRRGDAQFVAAGDVTAVFGEDRVQRRMWAWDDDPGDLSDEDKAEPQWIVKGLLDAGDFDVSNPKHVELARGMLAEFPKD